MWGDMIIRFSGELPHFWIRNIFRRFVGIKKFETRPSWTWIQWSTKRWGFWIMAEVVWLERCWNFSPCVIDEILYWLAGKTRDIP